MTQRLSIALNIVLLAFMAWYFLVHKDMLAYYERRSGPKEAFLEDIYYKARVDAYAALNARTRGERVVVAGDSIAAQLPVDELLPSGALNRGVGMDTSRGVLLRLDENINNLDISSLFLIVGHNDVKYRSVEEAARNISLVFSRARAGGKYFISVLPTADRRLDELIRELNEAVRKGAASGGYEYIDLYAEFLNADGSLNRGLFYDGVHPNAKGYFILAGGVEKALAEGSRRGAKAAGLDLSAR